MNATLSRPVVKATVLFDPSMVKAPASFGRGVFPQKPARLPIAPSTSDLDAIKGDCPATAPTDGECIDRFYSQTMSSAEYREFLAHARSAELDRLARCDQAEWSEVGADESSFSDDYLDAMAEEARQLDAVCGFSFGEVCPQCGEIHDPAGDSWDSFHDDSAWGLVEPAAPEPEPAPKARKPRRKVETRHHRNKAAAKALASLESPLDAMSADQLIAVFTALHAALPPRPLGWTTADAIREFPEIGRKMDAINHALACCPA